jgi:Flp pilus assembly protein TadG
MRNSMDAFVVSTRRKLRAFGKNHLGSVTTISAVAALPMMLAAGAAIDTVRINREQVAFNASVDAAALAVAADDRSSMNGLSESQKAARIAELETFAKKYMAADYTPQYGSSPDMAVHITITGQSVDLTASHNFPTTIMSLTGIDDINLTAHSQVMKAMRPIEIALVMDTTGSMASSGKIAGAKTAAHSLLNTLYGGTLASTPESEYIRVALVPFAAAVRLDKNAYDFNLGWIDTTGVNPISKLNFNSAPTPPTTWNNYTAWAKLKKTSTVYQTWNGCVEARMTGTAASNTDYNANDTAPTTATPATMFPAYFAPDTPSFGSSGTYGSYKNTSWTGSYIAEDTNTPQEITGVSSANAKLTTDAAILQYRQENYQKYDGRNIGAETTAATPDGPWSGCAKTPVVPMTHKRSNVETGIDAMSAAGPTLIAEGLSWGWRVISPTEPFTKVEGTSSIPASTISTYNHPRWQKIMVLMTDGDNDLSAGTDTLNGTVYSSYGRGTEPIANNRFGSTSSSNKMTELDNQMLNVCSKIKANGIKLYVTSFGTGVSATTKTRLQTCATDPTYYQHSTSSADLQAFFNHVGEDVLNKSIYVSK